jgi:glycosyltransferase involved in cell wall biosynthesis
MSTLPNPTPTSRPLRLLNAAASVNPAAGGVSEAILRLSRSVTELGHEVETLTTDDPTADWAQALPPSVHLQGPAQGPLEYARGFHQWLAANAGRFDAIISHGVWRDNSRAARAAARAAGVPYFVFPHGMLDPWFKRYYPVKHIKKSVYWWLHEYAVLRDAAAVLFTCEEEKRLARESFWPYRCTERVVPLGTGTPPENVEAQRAAYAAKFPELTGKRVILFLGRLHVKKGCDLLLRAFLQLLRGQPRERSADLHLMMAGPTAHPDYLATLHEIAAECQRLAPGSVSFPGMVSGDLKWGVLRSAEVFVLPSHQENFGIAVAEAMAVGTPVLITRPVNIWREIEASGSGLVEADTDEGCAQLLARWLLLTPDEKAAMGRRAAETFQQKFEISQTARSLVATIREYLPVKRRREGDV